MNKLLLLLLAGGLTSLAATAQNAPILQWQKLYANRNQPEAEVV